MKTRLISPILLLVLLGSCFAPSSRPLRVELGTSVQDDAKTLRQLENKYGKSATTEEERRLIRERYTTIMMRLVDDAYNDFLDEVIAKRKGFDSGSDITAVALDTASVLFTPASTKSILAGLSGFVTASKASIDKAYFYDRTLPVIVSQMEASRKKVRAQIFAKLALTREGAYPLHVLVSDLGRYYHAGTIEGALEDIQESAALTSSEAIGDLQVEADNELEKQKAILERERDALKSEADFQFLRGRVLADWEKLTDEVQGEVAGLIPAFAASAGMDISAYLVDGADPAEVRIDAFAELVGALRYDVPEERALLPIISGAILEE